MRGLRIGSFLLLAISLALLGTAGAACAQGSASDGKPEERRADTPAPAAPPPPASPIRLFAAVEEAWLAGAAESFAALVDTASVRISLKPGGVPTSAPTRSAAAFLFQDQLRLVTRQTFQIQKVAVSKSTASATALWTGDWGGRVGVRTVKVTMAAAPTGGRWLLREVRAKG